VRFFRWLRGLLCPPVDELYRERAHLVAALARRYAAWSVLVPAPDAPGWTLLCVEHPTAVQMSWHISPADMDLFAGLRQAESHRWDGHSTEEKYARLDRIAG
jgi:hypothetical protein